MSLPTVNVKVNNVTVPNVQGYRITKGRQRASDPLRAGTAVVTGRVPSSLPSIAIGDVLLIDVRPTPTSLGYAFLFRVADFRIDYGTVAAMDTWTITAEDSLAVLGRATVDVSWAANSTSYTAMAAVCTAAGITSVQQLATQSEVSAQTLTDVNALDVFSTLMATEQGRVVTGYTSTTGSPRVLIYGRGWPQDATLFYLSDDGSGTNPVKYTNIEFAGLADNYADKVVVEPVGLATQTAGTGDFSYVTKSYSETTGDAESLAQYLVGVFTVQDDQPAVVQMRMAGNSDVARDNAVGLCEGLSILNIKFRGNTYRAMVEGFTLSGSLDEIFITCYLSSTDFYPIFILDDTLNGVLNQNRLGY